MRSRFAAIVYVAVALWLCTATTAGAASALTLWYDRPAADWERQGLPIGNGAMGAMVTGGVAEDHLQFNEKTLWTGGPGSVQGYDFGLPDHPLADAVAQVRATIARDGRMEPEAVAKILGHKAKGYGDYQNFGEVVLAFTGLPDAPQDYRRELDIAHAVARVSFTANGIHYTREYFADYPDHVIVERIAADRPEAVSFHAFFTIPDNRTVSLSAVDGLITASGALNDNGLKYEAGLKVIATGGTRSDGADGGVTVAGADSVVLILSAGTNYALSYPGDRGADPHGAVAAGMQAAVVKGYDALLAAHERDYTALFGRVSLDIGQAMPDEPTDKLLAQYTSGAAAPDRALEALYFQYGRYLLIAASRAGSLPANLQGVWNNSATPPWNADYHVNINLQMNYWLAETANLSDLTPPLFDLVDGLVMPGRLAAKRIFGAHGWVINLNTNPWGYAGLIDWPTAFWQPEAAAWMAQHYYDHYRFSQDRAFLKTRAYPLMKEASQFWLETLVTDPRDGRLVVSPSYSPEHGAFSAGASMSQQIVFDLFTNTAEAAATLGDHAFRARLQAALAKLDPGLREGSWGQLREWKEDWDDRADDHRHVSHLFALHPGHQISPLTTPNLAQAARVTLAARGDGGTGWSKAWKINFWARLRDGDHAHTMLAQQLTMSTMPNLWDTHPPFQIDGNFGATGGVVEMLLQSQNGEIDILPALPSAWPQGHVTGLRARGDVTVDIDWADGRARRIVLVAGHTGLIAVRSTIFAGRYRASDALRLKGNGAQRVFAVKKGARYIIQALP
jgi:alpha-L-fucosidase 2